MGGGARRGKFGSLPLPAAAACLAPCHTEPEPVGHACDGAAVPGRPGGPPAAPAMTLSPQGTACGGGPDRRSGLLRPASPYRATVTRDYD